MFGNYLLRMKISLSFSYLIDSMMMLLLEPMEVKWKGKVFIIPENFVSDGCSCPEWLWPFCGALHYADVYILHDYLYEFHLVSRAEADLILLQMLLERRNGQDQGSDNLWCRKSIRRFTL